jgi:hypothetical protein
MCECFFLTCWGNPESQDELRTPLRTFKRRLQGVYNIVHSFVAAWGLDTQEIEGVNSVLKYAATLSPNISFKLLSSRITTKKLINSCKTREARASMLQDFEYFFQRGTSQSHCFGPLPHSI